METATKTSTQQKPISIKRTFDLPLKTVWKAWSESESMKKWWGPNNFTCPHCEIDFREGGRCLGCMKAPDGKEMWSVNTYKQIIPLKKIVMTDNFSDNKGNIISPDEAGMPGDWGKNPTITIELNENHNKTEFALLHEGVPTEMYDDCIQGWQECLDKLEKNVK